VKRASEPGSPARLELHRAGPRVGAVNALLWGSRAPLALVWLRADSEKLQSFPSL